MSESRDSIGDSLEILFHQFVFQTDGFSGGKPTSKLFIGAASAAIGALAGVVAGDSTPRRPASLESTASAAPASRASRFDMEHASQNNGPQSSDVGHVRTLGHRVPVARAGSGRKRPHIGEPGPDRECLTLGTRSL